ncbi:hypothetical protein [Streptomyces sp. B1I3]|uniref:hypothetical protein n=1 Tax=Streptomyces sp. B1I3 TaxID=3042264 RepID=UPI00278B0054|nr:hypothetical protein [Streptomyces sp. B1I3]MDQ0796101.1 hypothetical protein [Streptomyces sp. B1I3]
MLPSEVGASMAAVPFVGLAASAAGAADLATELTSFTKFRDRIDEILRDLKASPAGPQKVGEDPLSRPQFGGGDMQWAEAANLFVSYQKVVTELETLSKLLSESIEGMSIAVLASHKGYENLDVDIRRRMLAITDNAENHYGGEYDPSQESKQNTDAPGTEKSAKPTPGASTGSA